MMKRIRALAWPLAAAVALAALGGAAGAAGAQTKKKQQAERIPVDRVVAVVNDSIILYSELMRRVAPILAEMESASDPRERERRERTLAGQVLDEMINEELIVQAAEEAKLEVTEQEIDNALGEIKRQNNLDDKGLADALRGQGYTVTAYRKDVRRQILRMRAVNVLVRPRVNITDEDVRAYYDQRSRRSGAVSKVHLHHILIALPAKPTDAQVRAAKEQASQLVTRARNGESFEELARQYSDDPGTSDAGGDLGWIERGSIATEWEAIVFSMSKGDVRGPISGPRGLHVFYVSELEKAEVKPFEEVKEDLHNDLYRREMDKQTQLWLDEQRKKAHIEVKL